MARKKAVRKTMPLGMVRTVAGLDRHLEKLAILGEGKFQAKLFETATRRVAPEKLEKLVLLDSIISAIIFKYVRLIAGGEFVLEGDQDAINAVMPLVTDKRAGFRACIKRGVYDIWRNGRAFIELGKNQAGNDIVKLQCLDPKEVDFQRDSSGEVLLDDENEPVGFIYRENTEDEVEFSRKEIAHLKFFEIPGDMLGYTPLEAVYKDALIGLNLREAFGEGAFRKGFALLLALLGDKDHYPTTENIDEMEKMLTDISSKTEMVAPYWVNIKPVDFGDITPLVEGMNVYLDILIAGMGMPRPMVITPPTGRLTGAMAALLQEFGKDIAEFKRDLADQIESQVFARKLELMGKDPSKAPTIRWIEMSPVEKRERARRLGILARSALIKYDTSVEDQLLAEEGLSKKPGTTLKRVIDKLRS